MYDLRRKGAIRGMHLLCLGPKGLDLMESPRFDMQPALTAMLEGAARGIELLPWWIVLLISLFVIALIAFKLRALLLRPRDREIAIAARRRR